jgi:hypothetical protein
MKFELYKDVVLTRDLPKERLKRGDIVKLVEHHPGRDREDGPPRCATPWGTRLFPFTFMTCHFPEAFTESSLSMSSGSSSSCRLIHISRFRGSALIALSIARLSRYSAASAVIVH